jgi:hypothetical protein
MVECKLLPMFVERKVRYSALFTNLVGWHAGDVSFPLSDIILAQLSRPMIDIMFCLHSGITNLSLSTNIEFKSLECCKFRPSKSLSETDYALT